VSGEVLYPPLWLLPEEARRAIWSVTEYEPSPEQLAAHLDEVRVKMVAGGERAGKSRMTAEELVCWIVAQAAFGPALFWIVGPDYKQARPEFIHLVTALEKLDAIKPGSVSMPQEGPCSLMTRFDSRVETKSSSDPQGLGGVPPAGVCMVEAAQHVEEAFYRLRGRVAEKRGPLLLSGTFEGSLGWYADRWRAWQLPNADGARSYSVPTWANRAIFPGGREDPEIKALEATYPPEAFMERFGAVPCPPATVVFREFDPKVHVRSCPFDPALPVQVWIDPGYATAYVVDAVQMHGEDVWHIDEVYETRVVAPKVIQKCMAKPWWKNVRFGVMDVAGRQHQGMESHVEIWRRLARIPIRSQKVSIEDGILRHKTFLRDPKTGQARLFHDKDRCKHTIAEYGLYRYPVDADGSVTKEVPRDRDNHSMKALAYGLVWNFGMVDSKGARAKVRVRFRRG